MKSGLALIPFCYNAFPALTFLLDLIYKKINDIFIISVKEKIVRD